MTRTAEKRRGALLLGLFGPWGLGHYYLGQPRRALAWFLGPTFVFVLGVALCPVLGDALGFRLLEKLAVGFILVAWAASALDAVRLADAAAPDVPRAHVLGYWALGLFVSRVVIAIPMKAFLLESFKIPSQSMLPALIPGDRVMVDKLAGAARRPKRGEVIAFHAPENPENVLVKRVMAIGGDTVVVRDGNPAVNGVDVPRCFVGMAHGLSADGKAGGPVFLEQLDGTKYLSFFDMSAVTSKARSLMKVPDGEVWVLSDNRNDGEDSRSWFGGRGAAVPQRLVIGRALFRYWSEADGKSDPSRTGTRVADVLLPPSMADLAPGLAKCLAENPSSAPVPAHS